LTTNFLAQKHSPLHEKQKHYTAMPFVKIIQTSQFFKFFSGFYLEIQNSHTFNEDNLQVQHHKASALGS
jgi:hypothetical protein